LGFLGVIVPVGQLPLQLDRQGDGRCEREGGCMLNEEASRSRTVEGQDDQVEEKPTIDGLAKKYPGGPLRQQRVGQQGQTREHMSLQEC
jgi:hypothetical protein